MVSAAGIRSFIVEKFWTPIASESTFYNPYNTAVYAILFGLGVLYLGYPIVKRADLELDRNFFLALTPYVFLGGVLRATKDVNIFETILLETPFIYFVMAAFTLVVLLASLKLEEITDLEYWKPTFAAGTIALFALLGTFPVSNASALLTAFLLFSPFAVGVYYGTELFLPRIAELKFQIPVIAHYFDATTSVVSLMNGGAEKHVLAGWFVKTMGLPGMYVLKTIIIVPATYMLYESTESDLQNFVLFIVALLGFALGTRNLVATVALS